MHALPIFLPFAIVFGLVAHGIFRLDGIRGRAARWFALLIGVVLGIVAYLDLPVLALDFAALGWYLCLIAVATFVVALYYFKDERERRHYHNNNPKSSGLGGGASIIAFVISLIWVIVIPIVTTWAAFSPTAYRALLGAVEESTLDTEIPPIDNAFVRTVDKSVALMLMQRQLGQDAGLGSRAMVGDPHIQILTGTFKVTDPRGVSTTLNFGERGHLFWVAPIVHSGAIRQVNNGTTPGYALASATDQTKVYLVEKVNDKPVTLNYFDEGGYFDRNVHRHIYLHGYMSVGINDFSFEIDNTGHPFWVATRYVRKIGFGGEDAVGVIIVDAQSGAITSYPIDKIPAWVNLVQPKVFVEEQFNHWGKLVHGWWNGFLASNDVVKITPGMEYIFGEDGRGKWYSGVISTGNDKSMAGMVFVDGITKKVTLKRFGGIAEDAAVSAIENHPSVKAQGYTASSPIPYLVAKEPSYFFILKGRDGTPQGYGWMNVADFNAAATGRDPAEALRNYQVELRKKRTVTPDSKTKQETIEGRVFAVRQLVENGNTVIYIRINGALDKEFFGPATMNPAFKWTEVGDLVVVHFDASERAETVPLTTFEKK